MTPNPFILPEAKSHPRLTPQEALQVVQSLQEFGRLSPQQILAAKEKIQSIVTACDPLRKPAYQGAPNPLAGHCYVAAETLFHLLGGAEQKEWVAQQMSHEGSPHWFLKNKGSGEVLDPTAGQFSTPVPYDQSKGKGFLTKEPSARAMYVLHKFFFESQEVTEDLRPGFQPGVVSPELLKLLKGRNPLVERDYDWLVEMSEWAMGWASSMKTPKERALQAEMARALAQNPNLPATEQIVSELLGANLDIFALHNPRARDMVTIPGFWQQPNWQTGIGWSNIQNNIMKMPAALQDRVFSRLFGKIFKSLTFVKAVREPENVKRWPRLPLKMDVFETGVVRELSQDRVTWLFSDVSTWVRSCHMKMSTLEELADR